MATLQETLEAKIPQWRSEIGALVKVHSRPTSTLSLTTRLVTLPNALLTITEYPPASLPSTSLNVSVGLCAPEILPPSLKLTPSLSHW